MAFKKTVRKYATKKNFKKGAKFAYKHRGTAQRALKLALKLKDMVNIEYKHSDHTWLFNQLGDGTNNGAVIQSTFFNNLNQFIGQGTGHNQRIGNSIKAQRLSGRGTIRWIGGAVPVGQLTANVRIIIMRGKADNQRAYYTADPTIPGATGGVYLDQKGVNGAKSENSKYETKTIHDKIYTLDVARRNMINLNWNFPLNWHINFEEDGGANTQDGGLYLAILTDTGIVPMVDVNLRLDISYTDN
uniref:Capsid protein n=1 Tax=Cressdnaviricota sp. TaxID=2748378 RepID=A0A6M9Z7Y0_9VIRU|nr:MAG: capsid protein [Cressdnaviricota sp.]